MRALTTVAKALADESRIRVLAALGGGELCVCQLVELLELAPSTVSRHLALLRQAGLIDARKQGRWVHYRLAGGTSPPAVRGALDFVRAGLEGDPAAAADLVRLRAIRAQDPEVLCSQQRGEPVRARRRSGDGTGARGTTP